MNPRTKHASTVVARLAAFAAVAMWGISFVGALVFLDIGCSGLGYLFWYAALERIEASQLAAFLHLEPLVTFAAAVILLREPVAPSTVLGGGLVLAGVFTVQQA